MSTTYALNIGRHGIEKTVETTTIYGMLCRIRYSKDHPWRYDTQWFAHHGESESDANAQTKQADCYTSI